MSSPPREDIRPRRHVLVRALSHPLRTLKAVSAIARGQYYRLKFRLLRRRVVIGRSFRVEGRLDIRGPGTVIFGDHCLVVSTRINPATPWTHAPGAVIQIGDRVFVNGTRFGCMTRIEVGDDSILAAAHILDTDFHPVDSPDLPRIKGRGATAPVRIGRHTWIAAGSMVLKGVTIGENTVVAAGTVVTRDVQANVVVAGNPATVVRELTPRTGA